MSNPVDRVAAAALTVRPFRVLLSVLAAPFYVLGFVVGIVLVCLSWCYAAVQVGVSDARSREVSDVAS